MILKCPLRGNHRADQDKNNMSVRGDSAGFRVVKSTFEYLHICVQGAFLKIGAQDCFLFDRNEILYADRG